jgi:regulator of protease activity HflC (stomatin/prohibitin superfamily)
VSIFIKSTTRIDRNGREYVEKTPNIPAIVSVAVGGVFGATFLLSTISSSYYVVDPNEVAYVTRAGNVISDSPVEPGLHFKIPYLDKVDNLMTSLTQLKIDPVDVKTLDNQSVRLGINVSYRIPGSAVRHLLYEVGRKGNVDIDSAMMNVVLDRSLRVFATHNTIKISEERDAITNAMKEQVSDKIREMFGVEIVDLQITHLEYSQQFQASVEAAVQAKNLAIQAENATRQIQAQAAQTKIKAEADSYAKKQEVDAEAYSIHENAKAEAFAITEKGAALAKNPNITAQTIAERWDGKLPTQMVPGGTVPFLKLQQPQQ